MPRLLAPSVGTAEPTGEIDLRAIGAALKRRRSAWLLPTLGAMVVVGIFVNVVTPRFTAQSQILLENQETFFTRPDRLPDPTASQLDEAAVASQVQLISSPDIARRAIKALHLEGNDEFDPLAKGMNPISRMLVLLGVLPDPTRESAESRMVQTFEQKLTVFSPPKTRVVTIEFTSRDPKLASRGANEVAALYLQEQSAAKRAMAKDSAEALAAQIADLRVKLADADAARERYRSSSGLIGGTSTMTMSGQSLADLNTDLSRARAQQADAQAKAATIRDLLAQGRAADVADITNAPIVRQLWNQRSQAQAQLALESRTLLPEHPRVKELTAQLKEYDATLKSAAKQVATSLENDAKIAGQRVANLDTALAQQKKLVGVANTDAVHLAALDRVAQGYKDQLQSSTTKYEEATARQSSTATPADARIISRAAPPQEPSYPKKLPFVIFGTLATLVFAVGWVVAGEILSGRADLGATPETPRPAVPVHVEEPPSGATLAATPRRRSSDLIAKAGVDDGWADAPTRAAIAARVFEPAGPRSATLFDRFAMLRRLGGKREDADVVLAHVSHGVGPRTFGIPRRVEDAIATFVASIAAFGRSAAASRTEPVIAPSASGVGWDVHAAPAPSAAASAFDRKVDTSVAIDRAAVDYAVGDDAHEGFDLHDVAWRIVAAHVPGRGLHVVGTGVGADPAASDTLVALARSLAEKGRSIVVDLNATPAKLARLGAAENGRAVVTMLAGLSELLAGEASFAEVIHRDHATRLHFIPTGRKEADFRDFDLILDALTETYDFIVLLTPSFPQSEIAKVMAPYADFVVLSAADGEADVTNSLEDELTAAGAREVLLVGPSARKARSRIVA